jgi:hypothetical protein
MTDGDISDIRVVSDRLEGTYLIRIFAEFEVGLRHFWHAAKATNPPEESLINGIRRLRHIPQGLTDPVHSVRKYRNALVHDREDDVPAISLNVACGCLCKFFARLPPDWP